MPPAGSVWLRPLDTGSLETGVTDTGLVEPRFLILGLGAPAAVSSTPEDRLENQGGKKRGPFTGSKAQKTWAKILTNLSCIYRDGVCERESFVNILPDIRTLFA